MKNTVTVQRGLFGPCTNPAALEAAAALPSNPTSSSSRHATIRLPPRHTRANPPPPRRRDAPRSTLFHVNEPESHDDVPYREHTQIDRATVPARTTGHHNPSPPSLSPHPLTLLVSDLVRCSECDWSVPGLRQIPGGRHPCHARSV